MICVIVFLNIIEAIRHSPIGKPWILVYYEAYVSKMDAVEEEIFLKSGKGRERLNICLRQTLKRVNGEVA